MNHTSLYTVDKMVANLAVHVKGFRCFYVTRTAEIARQSKMLIKDHTKNYAGEDAKVYSESDNNLYVIHRNGEMSTIDFICKDELENIEDGSLIVWIHPTKWLKDFHYWMEAIWNCTNYVHDNDFEMVRGANCFYNRAGIKGVLRKYYDGMPYFKPFTPGMTKSDNNDEIPTWTPERTTFVFEVVQFETALSEIKNLKISDGQQTDGGDPRKRAEEDQMLQRTTQDIGSAITSSHHGL